YLVILGGICIALFLIVFGRRLLPRLVTVEPGVLAAAAVVAVFSCLIWPRSARMFSVVVPFMIYLFARAAQRVYDQAGSGNALSPPSENDRPAAHRQRAATAGALIVATVLALRAPFAGECFTLPTGVREVNAFITGNMRMSKGGDIGAYLWPNFQLSAPSGREWKYIPKHTSLGTGSSLVWAVTGEMVEEMILEEQALHGGVSLNWRTNQLAILALLRRGNRGAEFPNGFYTSKWYISESVFEDGYLLFLLRRAATIRNPKWQLRSVAHALRGI
ncbi:MAG TPA: hypothetical protein VM118_06765, partial [Acidobacteriota bacterium]|nr:hypothetical protein [Acidobacteriota bacterium]